MALNARQTTFINEYFLCGLNATEAAKKAGYSDATARQQGSRLLTNVNIRAEIDRRMAEMAMPANEVLARLAEHARSTMEDFIEIKGGLPFIQLDNAQQVGKLHLLKKFKVTKQGVEIELYDAQAALRDLGRAHGLFKDRVEHSGTVTWEKLMTAEPESDAPDDDGDPFS